MQTLRLQTPKWQKVWWSFLRHRLHLSSHKAQSCMGCVNQNNHVIKTKETIQLGRPSADTNIFTGHQDFTPNKDQIQVRLECTKRFSSHICGERKNVQHLQHVGPLLSRFNPEGNQSGSGRRPTFTPAGTTAPSSG